MLPRQDRESGQEEDFGFMDRVIVRDEGSAYDGMFGFVVDHRIPKRLIVLVDALGEQWYGPAERLELVYRVRKAPS